MKINSIFIVVCVFTSVKCYELNRTRRGINVIETIKNETYKFMGYMEKQGRSIKQYYYKNINCVIGSCSEKNVEVTNDILRSKFKKYIEQAEYIGSNVYDVIAGKKERYECNEDDTINTMTTTQLIATHGYPSESHTIITDDGYILTVHRIPYSKKSVNKVIQNKTVLIHHGVLGSSADWVFPGPNKSLAYLLSDAGYDVWIANARGNTYSRAHLVWHQSDFQFWNFSFHEVGQHDLPAVINYILERKGPDQKINYVGFSMGTTALFTLLSTKPQYNEKIRAVFALAPVAYMAEVDGPLKVLSKYGNDIEKLLRLFGNHNFLPENTLGRYLSKHSCKIARIEEAVCEMSLFILCDRPEKAHFDRSLIPMVLGHIPAGTSTKTIAHFGQIIKSNGKFQEFDYGSAENLKAYGTETPPEYPIENITVPIALFSGESDGISTMVDAKNLYKRLRNAINHYTVPEKSFSHLDFLFARDATELVYMKLMNVLKMTYFLQE